MLVLQKYLFKKVCNIKPQTRNGEIYTHSPQNRYNNVDNRPLHKYGAGTFCKFSIPKRYNNLAGIYIIVTEQRIVYLGKCVDLLNRFNIGYGNISPRNCFVGGQSTNCKINKNILEIAREGKEIELFFYENNLERSEIEKELIKETQPNWNSQLK